MAEIMTNVYDILLPSPPVLKEIASISVAVQLWRQEINSHRIRNTLSQLNFAKNILPDHPMPRIPATTMPLIKKHVKRVGPSIKHWMDVHSHLDLFKTDIFDDFTDFVGDFDGTIHYVKTARKMILCERIDQVTRFKIACTYCFENDISRIWPSVSSHFNKTSDFHDRNRLLYYWLCQLKNQLYKLSHPDTDRLCIEEQYFNRNHFFPCWSSFDYFWHRVDTNSRTQIIEHLPVSFNGYYRYLLPKFNEVQLTEFANTKGYSILHEILVNKASYHQPQSSLHNVEVQSRESYIVAIWKHIRNNFSENNFFRLVRKIIRARFKSPDYFPQDRCTSCELWKIAPNNLKQHAIRHIILIADDSLFKPDSSYCRRQGLFPDSRFLLTVLSDASAEDGIIFWNTYWRVLVTAMCTEQFAQLMSLCFRNDEDRIVEFKRNSLSVLDNIREKCSILINYLIFGELNKFLNFCSPDEQTRKTIRRALLVEEFKFHFKNMKYISSPFIDFINDAYDDIDLAAQFRIQLLSAPSTMAEFRELSSRGASDYHRVDGSFIDKLAPSQQAAREVKRLYIALLLKQKFIESSSCQTDEDKFSNFISEFLESEDETARFKETLPVDEIVQDAIRSAVGDRFHGAIPLKYNCFLVRFLEWYFDTSQALEEFKAKYADDDVFVQFTTKESNLKMT